MRLPMHITGITEREINLEQMDGQFFQRLGYEITRNVKGNVICWHPPQYPLNYFRIDIELGEKIVSILLHEFFPYAAIASYKNALQIEFTDHVEITNGLKPYYKVLETKFLNESFNANLHDLSKIERLNVKHWRPRTNGEVIFNCWD